jgi:transposase
MSKIKLYTSRAWLYKRYVVDRLTEEEIAKLANTTQATINRWIEKHNIKRKSD